MALQAMGDATLSDEEQLYISGLVTLSDYRSVQQKMTRVLTSRRTGTIEIGHVEWKSYLVDICRVMVPLPYGDTDRIDMQDTIDALLDSMQFTSSMGNVPLSELVFQPFPRHSHAAVLPPLVFDTVSPLLLDIDTDLVSSSISSTSSFVTSDSLYPTSPSFFSAPSQVAFPEWNPSADPVVESGPRRAKNIAPGSAQAVYDLDGIESANPMSLCNLVHGYGLMRLHQPRPKHIIKVDLIELAASLQEDSSVLLTTELHMTETRYAVNER